jgi:hypothetical protein
MAKRHANEHIAHIALFIDLENFFGYCNCLGLPIDLAPELEKLTEIGKITVRKSFGDIQKLPIPGDKKQEVRKMLQHNLIVHEDIPYHNGFKNSADIRLVIEALSMVFSNDDIDLVAVVGSDRDYLPLFAKLREIGKEIIGIGGSKDGTPDIYVRACDYFFYHESLCNAVPRCELVSTPASEPKAELAEAPQSEHVPGDGATRDEGISLLIDSLRALEAKGYERILGAAVLPMMRRLKADFDLSAYGYTSFKALCDKAVKKGVIEMGRSGSDVHLKLVEQSERLPEPVAEPEVVSESVKEAHEILMEWLENKMKITMPHVDDRMEIYKHLQEALTSAPVIPLTELANITAERNKNKQSGDQQTVYKILYSLYRANCFSCSQGTTPYNPIVNSFRTPVEDHQHLDKLLIQNSMRHYLRERKGTIDPEAWSSVFFKSDSHAELVKEIALSL